LDGPNRGGGEPAEWRGLHSRPFEAIRSYSNLKIPFRVAAFWWPIVSPRPGLGFLGTLTPRLAPGLRRGLPSSGAPRLSCNHAVGFEALGVPPGVFSRRVEIVGRRGANFFGEPFTAVGPVGGTPTGATETVALPFFNCITTAKAAPGIPDRRRGVRVSRSERLGLRLRLGAGSKALKPEVYARIARGVWSAGLRRAEGATAPQAGVCPRFRTIWSARKRRQAGRTPCASRNPSGLYGIGSRALPAPQQSIDIPPLLF
jgi:hypothetical protein